MVARLTEDSTTKTKDKLKYARIPPNKIENKIGISYSIRVKDVPMMRITAEK